MGGFDDIYVNGAKMSGDDLIRAIGFLDASKLGADTAKGLQSVMSDIASSSFNKSKGAVFQLLRIVNATALGKTVSKVEVKQPVKIEAPNRVYNRRPNQSLNDVAEDTKNWKLKNQRDNFRKAFLLKTDGDEKVGQMLVDLTAFSRSNPKVFSPKWVFPAVEGRTLAGLKDDFISHLGNPKVIENLRKVTGLNDADVKRLIKSIKDTSADIFFELEDLAAIGNKLNNP